MEEVAHHDAAGKPIEVWFEDEARIGQKTKITRRWAKRGTRPVALCDQRTASAYIFGAICPQDGKERSPGHCPRRNIVAIEPALAADPRPR